MSTNHLRGYKCLKKQRKVQLFFQFASLCIIFHLHLDFADFVKSILEFCAFHFCTTHYFVQLKNQFLKDLCRYCKTFNHKLTRA